MDVVTCQVPGGVLKLCCSGETAPQYWCEYEGCLPREIALELVRQTVVAEAGLVINGGTLTELLEHLDLG